MDKTVVVMLVTVGWAHAQERDVVPRASPIAAATIQKAVGQGHVVGAQLLIGRGGAVEFERSFGKRDRETGEKVDSATLFCIGSCSKAFASACVLSLAGEEHLKLDDEIDTWLKAYGELSVRVRGKPKAKAVRAPTVLELACHRSGIFSQREKPPAAAMASIRRFTSSLEQSVAIIATVPLSSQPGTRFAYSGAGYCVLGRVAEVAAKAPFESLLQTRLGKPLGFSRTTYFPKPDEDNVAVPYVKSDGEEIPNRRAPHRLGKRLRFPLIGGSLYSTARETARFAEMIAAKGQFKGEAVLKESLWQQFVKPQSKKDSYSLGFRQTFAKGEKMATALSHSGSLYGYRSMIHIDLSTGRYIICNLSTRVGGGASAAVRRIFRDCRAK